MTLTLAHNDKLSPHFTLGELLYSAVAARHSVPNNLPAGQEARILRNLRRLCEDVLEPCRAHFKRPIRPGSGYRSPRVNALVGGSRSSQHLQGEAVDFEVIGVPNGALAVWVKQNLRFDQLILEAHTPSQPTSGWVHVSLRASDNRGEVLSWIPNVGYKKGLAL